MVFGIFSTAEQKIKARNLHLFTSAKAIYEKQKLMFRDNAISKLSFMNPRMKFILNTQCDFFAGIDSDSESFIWGHFDDRKLPNLRELEDSQKYSDFPDLCDSFVTLIRDFYPLGIDSRKVEAGEIGFSFYEGDFIFDLQVAKNGKVICRSNASNPKPIGYFRDSLYRHVVQDINGSGVSELRARLYISNYAENFCQDIFFHYQDPPRKVESQSRDHYINVCSLFLPFLEAGELQLRSAGFAEGGKFDVTNWDNGGDLKVIGSTIE